MIYVGADLSTTSSGIGIFNDEELLYHNCLAPKITKKTPKIGETEPWETRIYLMAQMLNEIFDKYNIEEAYCEDIPLKDGKPTIKKLGVIRGTFLSCCAIHGVKINPRQVSEWRQDAGFFDGTREGMTRDEMKAKAVEEVKELFNLSLNDDEAEGILIGYRSRYPKQNKQFNRKK